MLQGYPGVAGLDSHGKQVTQADRTPLGYVGGIAGRGEPPLVILQPGRDASALVEASDTVDGAHLCPYLAHLLVTAPGQRASSRLANTMSVCQPFEVHPVVPGDIGNDPAP